MEAASPYEHLQLSCGHAAPNPWDSQGIPPNNSGDLNIPIDLPTRGKEYIMSNTTTTSTTTSTKANSARSLLQRRPSTGLVAGILGLAVWTFLSYGAGFNGLVDAHDWVNVKTVVAALVAAAAAWLLTHGHLLAGIASGVVLVLILAGDKLGLPSWLGLPDLSGAGVISWAIAFAIVLLAVAGFVRLTRKN